MFCCEVVEDGWKFKHIPSIQNTVLTMCGFVRGVQVLLNSPNRLVLCLFPSLSKKYYLCPIDKPLVILYTKDS